MQSIMTKILLSKVVLKLGPEHSIKRYAAKMEQTGLRTFLKSPQVAAELSFFCSIAIKPLLGPRAPYDGRPCALTQTSSWYMQRKNFVALYIGVFGMTN